MLQVGSPTPLLTPESTLMSTAVRTLYALVYSNRSAPFAVSSAWEHTPETFVLSRIRNRPSAENLIRVYLLTARTMVPANFRLTEFSKVRMDRDR
jgi:hypothetical protein